MPGTDPKLVVIVLNGLFEIFDKDCHLGNATFQKWERESWFLPSGFVILFS